MLDYLEWVRVLDLFHILEQVLDILYEGQDGLTRVGHCLTQGESGVRHIESGVRHIDLW